MYSSKQRNRVATEIATVCNGIFLSSKFWLLKCYSFLSFWVLRYKTRKSSFLFFLPSSSSTASGFGNWAQVDLHLCQSKKPLFSHIFSEVCFQTFKPVKWTFCRCCRKGRSSQYELQSVNIRINLVSRFNLFQGLNCTSEPFVFICASSLFKTTFFLSCKTCVCAFE